MLISPCTKVLLVEDNDGLRRVYKRLLEAHQFDVLTAEHGAAALDVLADQPIDVVVTDIGMPVMDGFELARQIRANSAIQVRRLVALTAYSQPQLVAQAQKCGIDVYLAKPINILDLKNAILGNWVEADYLHQPSQTDEYSSHESEKPTDSLRSRLRAATHDLHMNLERQLDLLNPNQDLSVYRKLLAAFYGFYVAIEARLAHAVEHEPWSSEILLRRKSSALRTDLVALGMSDNEIDQLPTALSLPEVRGLADVLGIMYVLEGSSLGGAILAKHFHSRLGLTRTNGASFFNFYGENLQNNWRQFLVWLESCSPPANESRMIAAAQTTFRTLGDWLLTQAKVVNTDKNLSSLNTHGSARSHHLR